MTMTATTAESFGALRPFPDHGGVGVRPPEARARRRHVDPANDAFEARRQALVYAGNRAPLERVAAFLVAISKNNSHEGRDPCAIPESLTCGFVADLLGFPIDTLASLLKALEGRGLVAPNSNSGLRLENLPGLEQLAHA